MSAQSVGEANKQLWDEALTRLLDLSTVTVKRNTDLEERLVRLEEELSLWKQSHSSLIAAAERDQKANNLQIATLNRQIASLDSLKNQTPLILCVVDGNANTFNKTLLSQGHQGGKLAAKELTKEIAEYLARENIQTVIKSELCTPEQLDGFLDGFTQSSPRFLVVETGSGMGSVDAKLREYLQTYTRFPQTLRVFFGGGFDGAYSSILTALDKEELLGKLVLLKGCNDPCPELRQLSLPTMNVENLFTIPQLNYPKHPGPISIPPPSLNGLTTNGGLISPQDSETSRYSLNTNPASASQSSGGQLIDLSKPLHKQSPPPCNEHYLMTCSKGPACKYSHDWLLTPEQLETLAKNAKKAPCNYLKNGQECPYGDKCCWGHVCPIGPKCFHLSKGKCWFKGENMHAVAIEEAL